MRRRITPHTYVSRSHPERDDAPDLERTVEVHQPAAAPHVPPMVEYEYCERCGDLHDPAVKCGARLHDEAAELLAQLRGSGALVTLKADETINVRGVKVDPEMVEALKSAKNALVAILKAEARS